MNEKSTNLPDEIENYRNKRMGSYWNSPMPRKITHKWNNYIEPANLYGLGEDGAYAYLKGRNLSEESLIYFAIYADDKGHPEMANGFWKRAYSAYLDISNPTNKKNRSLPPAKKETSQTQNNNEPIPFDVFLCHNSSDKPTVRHLAEELQIRKIAVWLDEWELIPGRPWQEALEKMIQTVNATAILVGSDGIGPWQDREIRGFLSEFVKRKLPVIPVLLPGAPEKPELPIFLKEFTWVDLRSGITKYGLDRLQWGITGKKPVDL